MRWRLGSICLLSLLLTACGGRTQAPVIENPYVIQMEELTDNGVVAMRRERWTAAEHSFTRALQAAQLAADPALIAHAWYNLAMAYAAQGRLEEADGALQQAEAQATRHHLPVELARARLNRALLAERGGRKGWRPESFSRHMPVDIHMAAARLADLQGRYATAKDEYRLVLALAGKGSAAMRYRAEAHLGLALLALQQKDQKEALAQSDQSLSLCRQVGAPRLAAHALMLRADLVSAPAEREDSLERARNIYHVLGDTDGERKALTALLAMAVKAGNPAAEKELRAALSALGKKEGHDARP